MTEGEVLTRKGELEKMLDQAVANANALKGAIQDCDFWLERLREKTPETPASLKIVKDDPIE